MMNSSPLSAKSVILYVDDDQDEHYLMQTALKQREDVDLVCYSDRDEFFAGLDQRYPDVAYVLLDLNMPKVNGVELAAELRNHEQYSKLPVVIITNGPDSPQAKSLKALGVNVVGKPSSFAELNSLVTNLFSKSN